MQIKIKEEWGVDRGENLANYIEEKLGMGFSGDGKLETMYSEIRNTTATLSKLIEKLAEKKIVSLKDISKFLNTLDFLEKEEAE